MKQLDNQEHKLKLRDFGAALVWAVAWIVVSSEFTVKAGSAAAALGAVLGYFAGHYLSATRLRSSVGAVLIPLVLAVTNLMASLPASSRFVASLLGAGSAFAAAAFGRWLLLALATVMLLKFLSKRHPAWIGAEVALVSLFLAAPFAAHRDGFINRPHFLIDPLWSRGLDPVPYLFGLGAIAAAVLVLLTIGRTSKRGSAFDLVILLGVVGLLYLYLPENKLRDWIPEPKGGLGLQGQPKDGKPEDGNGDGPSRPPLDGEGEGKQNQDPNDEIPFKDNYEQNPESRPIAVVILRDDYDPPYGFYYFRQSAFSQFNGRRLIADTTGNADLDVALNFPVQPTKVTDWEPAPYTHRKLTTRVALISSHTNPFGLANAIGMSPAPNPNPEQFERAYDVESYVLASDFRSLRNFQLGNPNWPEEMLEHYTQIPDDPRYREMADEIVASLDEQWRNNTLAWAVAVKLYLDKNAIYSLKSNHMSAEDPVASFLFGDKTGYCVHLAHAACYLFRSLGIPSRVAAGYATDGRFRSGSTILLRDREAHAWPEVYFEGLGWVIFDISPEQSLVDPLPQPDPDLARMLGEMARDEEESTDPKPEKSLRERLREWAEAAAKGLLILLLIAWLGLYGLKGYRRWCPYSASDDELSFVLYRAALDRLADAGIYRAYGQGRLSFAEQHQQTLEALEPLTRAHLSTTMGRPGGTSAPRKELFAHYRGVGEGVAQMVPAWRRILGMLNPLTILWVK